MLLPTATIFVYGSVHTATFCSYFFAHIQKQKKAHRRWGEIKDIMHEPKAFWVLFLGSKAEVGRRKKELKELYSSSNVLMCVCVCLLRKKYETLIICIEIRKHE